MRMRLPVRTGLLPLLTLLVAGCAATTTDEATLRITGSDTMVEILTRVVDDYRRIHPSRPASVEGGGSRAGIAALIAGRTDLAASSRPMLPDEARALLEARSTLGLGHLMMRDAISIYVHERNPVQSLTMTQLRELFTGRVRSWREVGGSDAPVRILIREAVSGTHLYFEEHVMLGDSYAPHARMFARTGDMIEQIAGDTTAIGYGGWGYQRDGVRRLRVNGVDAGDAQVREGSYPIARHLRFYSIGTPPEHVQHFIDWVHGPEGQRAIEEAGGLPLFPETD